MLHGGGGGEPEPDPKAGWTLKPVCRGKTGRQRAGPLRLDCEWKYSMQNDESGVPQYPKGDLRRMLAVLAAIDAVADATLVKVVARTGIDKKTVTVLVKQACEQAGVRVEKEGAIYRLVDWGPVLKKGGAKMALTGALNAPTIGS